MLRKIYLVHAQIVDANGTYNRLSNDYPKKFDSRQFDNDVEKTLKRAKGDASEVFGAYCKRDDRQVQAVFITDERGEVIPGTWQCVGVLPPDPNPETQTTEQNQNQGEGE